jgi:hypothetical protein
VRRCPMQNEGRPHQAEQDNQPPLDSSAALLPETDTSQASTQESADIAPGASGRTVSRWLRIDNPRKSIVRQMAG